MRGAVAEAAAEFKDVPKPARRLYFFWIGLPACASALLLAFTNHLSQNVAAIPFLWVLPLSLYLLSFILCFERAAWYRRNPFLQLLAVALGGMAYGLSEDFENTSIKVLIPLFSVGLFICCMVCHGELARLKPHPRYLTSYYVMISVGGALGGVFVGLMAPNLFQGYFELQICLAVCAVLVLAVLRRDPESPFHGAWRRPATLAAGLLALALIALCEHSNPPEQPGLPRHGAQLLRRPAGFGRQPGRTGQPAQAAARHHRPRRAVYRAPSAAGSPPLTTARSRASAWPSGSANRPGRCASA